LGLRAQSQVSTRVSASVLPRGACSERLLCAALLGLLLAAPARLVAQESPPADEGKTEGRNREVSQEPPSEKKGEARSPVEEVGGRLIVRSETVVVEANPDAPVLDSSIATKTDTPLLETPRSVSVLDRRTLDAIQVIDIAQAHDYTVGFTPADERGPAQSRGFRIGFYDLRRNGLRTYTWSVREPAALDRVQYLRGPAALLYGDGSPGGLVNLVLKQPLPLPRYAASLGAGQLGYQRATADLTGPLVSSRAIRYRLVAAGEKLDNGIDNDESRLSVLPMLAFDLGEKAQLQLDGEYYDQRGRGYADVLPVTPSGDLSIFPRGLNVASPDDSWRGWNASGGLRLDVRFSDAAELHVAGRYTRIDGDLDFHGPAGVDQSAGLLLRFAYRELSRWDEYQSDSFAVFKLGRGRVQHRLVAGVEAGLSQYDSQQGAGGAQPIALRNPVYPPRSAPPALRSLGSDILRLGSYVQDQIQLGRRFTLVPGLRFSSVGVEDRGAGAAPRSTNDVWSPALGAVFLPRPWLSAYASWSQGFEPPVAGELDQDGHPLQPTHTRSIEGGIKAELLERRLLLSAAGFGMRQTNVPEFDSAGFYRQIAEGASRGIELELDGSPARGLTLRAGYAWDRTEITRDLAGFTGRKLPNAPENKADLWVQYQVRHGASPLSLGAGVVHVGARFGDRANTLTLRAYTRLDATVSWQWRQGLLGLVLAAENLTDIRYATSASSSYVWVGAPRRVALTLTASF
jgi:iron complex outermembrane receptor protein